MSPRIWLPISHEGRTRNVLIPYTQDIDESQLEEIIAWQKEKTLKELKAAPKKKPISVARAEEIGLMLKDYTKFLKRKKGDINPKYY